MTRLLQHHLHRHTPSFKLLNKKKILKEKKTKTYTNIPITDINANNTALTHLQHTHTFALTHTHTQIYTYIELFTSYNG